MAVPPREYLLGQRDAWVSGTRLLLVSMCGVAVGALWAYSILSQFAFTDAMVEFTVYMTVTPLMIASGMQASYVLFYQIEVGTGRGSEDCS